jgi:hypothetical protein
MAVLGGALAIAAALTGAVGARWVGARAYESAAVAAVLNWAAGSAALATIFVSHRKPWRTQGVLLAMGVRMALPLAALAALVQSDHRLAAQGVAGMIVVHYLVGLVVETWMSVRLMASAPEPRTARLAANPHS